MQTPSGNLGRVLEQIMAAIRPHLLPDAPGSPVHYNRTYEAVAAGLEAFRLFEDHDQRGPR
jgi:hypothetical protein